MPVSVLTKKRKSITSLYLLVILLCQNWCAIGNPTWPELVKNCLFYLASKSGRRIGEKNETLSVGFSSLKPVITAMGIVSAWSSLCSNGTWSTIWHNQGYKRMYILENAEELLLECGNPWVDVSRLRFLMSRNSGCFVQEQTGRDQ